MVGMKKDLAGAHAPATWGRALVLGLGKSGMSVARYCASLIGARVDSLFIAAGKPTDAAKAFVREVDRDGVECAFGDDAIAGDVGHFDVCIASPGIPFHHELYKRAEQISDAVISEVEFAWRESAPESTWIAITGTNGKTTTTACIAHVLQAAGMKANAVGNIGDVCLDAVAAGETEVYVAEVSSYQLASSPTFAPDAAVMLGITPDHIHWHQTLEAYRDAKFHLLDAMTSAYGSDEPASGQRVAFAVLDATNDVVRAKVREVKAIDATKRGYSYVPIGTKAGLSGDMREACGAPNAAFVDADGFLHVAIDGAEHIVAQRDEVCVHGDHNMLNLLAAASIALNQGVSCEVVRQALKSFKPLEHRIEPCGTVAGVACFNDSKATNVDSTVKAIESFPGKGLVVLLGGDDKGTSLDELIASAHAHAKAVVCFGAAGPRFFDEFEASAPSAPEGFSCVRAGGMEDALDRALGLAQAGDVVVLSPACASFDEFTSFEHRGQVFKQLVAKRVSAVRETTEAEA